MLFVSLKLIGCSSSSRAGATSIGARQSDRASDSSAQSLGRENRMEGSLERRILRMDGRGQGIANGLMTERERR